MTSKGNAFFSIGLALAAVLAFSGCTNKEKSSSEKATADLFSNRSINSVPDLYLVTLQNPALLTVGKAGPNGWEIPADAKAKVIAEQDAFRKKLALISPDIEVFYSYKLTLNALAVYAPPEILDSISGLAEVKSLAPAKKLSRPLAIESSLKANLESAVNSVNFIGADKAHKLGFSGQGIKVALLDTGVDYTHAMLGGAGTAEAYKAVNPALPSEGFPNDKVVGGIDLVGSDFNAASDVDSARKPHPDSNPIDEAGHGTHVAGTIAGDGDGVNTYSGVAPDAKIYAVKVFGKEGSTMDAVVIAGIEFAADPNGDLNTADHLDVINLSLGGNYGTPNIRYTEAIKNIGAIGTVVVASAGNSGAVDYVVGAPSTADEAISVASIVDGSDVHWKFLAISADLADGAFVTKAVEGAVTKPLTEVAALDGELVDIGLADKDLTDEQKAALNGKIALIQRGGVAFLEKLGRAASAGAIGALVFNNAPGDAIVMGGEGKIEIPGVMLTQEAGLKIQAELKLHPVVAHLKISEKILEPDKVDQISDFSSKGPRTEDNLIKPEIAAPGSGITSASMGTGFEGVVFDGTSMAAPHMTGSIALLRQAFPKLSAQELKALAMNTSKELIKDGAPIPVTQQGAGRIQIEQALQSKAVATPASLSLGLVQIADTASQARSIKIKNISKLPLHLSTGFEASSGVQVTIQASVDVPVGAEVEVPVRFDITMPDTDQAFLALDSRIFFREGSQIVLQVPALAISVQASQMYGAPGSSEGQVRITNASKYDGAAFAFNLLGEDLRKEAPKGSEIWMGRTCDLKSAGYRIRTLDTAQGPVEFIEFAFKLFVPVTTWSLCDISVLIDSNGDGVAEQELGGINVNGIEGLPNTQPLSILLDAAKARDIRLAYEQGLAKGEAPGLTYEPAALDLQPMYAFDNSTVAIILAPVSLLAKTTDGKLNIKLAAQANVSAVESDDFLGDGVSKWQTISPKFEEQPYKINDEVSVIKGKESQTISVEKGSGQGGLVLYYPFNSGSVTGDGADTQQQIF